MKINQTAAEGLGLDLLRNEIEFWRELIGECTDKTDREYVERMQQALALAERNFQVRKGIENHGSNDEEFVPIIQ